MKKYIVLLVMAAMAAPSICAADTKIPLEPFTYKQDFETNELSAWASYPLWQDTAFDPNMRVSRMVPGDSNLSIVQKVTPYTHVDNYAGAQKKLDMFLVPGSSIELRYYLKTHLSPEFFKIRLAAGSDGKVDHTVSNPATNKWEWIAVTYDDFIKENPGLKGKNIKVNALAVLTKFPDADPAMPIYFGIDDVLFKGAKSVDFRFEEPSMFKLSEWEAYIPQKHFHQGETFSLKGGLPLNAGQVKLSIVSFTDPAKILYKTGLKKRGEDWFAKFKLSLPEGLYLAGLEAYEGNRKLSNTQFAIFIAPKNIGGTHPRLWFDSAKKEEVKARLRSARFKPVAENIISNAKKIREDNPLENVAYDLDQFPGGDIDPNWGFTIRPWFARIVFWRNAVHDNALAYSLLDDKDAGEYGKELLVKLSTFPSWMHPWWLDRGRHIYYPIGELGMDLALGYDLLYELMDESERRLVRRALKEQIVLGCHRGYVEDNLVTNTTSNWVAHITGGSLMCQAAMYGDGEDVADVEPYFSGAFFKVRDLLQKAFGRDGSYGEGYGYYNFTMLSLSKDLPAVEDVFKIDFSEKIKGTCQELIWAGLIKNKKVFYFGDSGGDLRPLTNWAWLLAKHKDPLLGWLYNHLKKDETFMDVLYETKNAPKQNPFEENPVRLFRDVGTTVFKSGWEKDDFVFVLRTGAFFNHQHIDQGTFWLADRGSVFVEDRLGSSYYDGPYYQSWYTQPVGHSTILIDRNHQSQRVGDPLAFAGGFHDHAFIYHFLDGTDAAFSSGDIGRLYWGKVKQMRRNVLYLKPRTLLMLDTIVPSEKDVDMTLLYHTAHLKDIHAGQKASTITKGENTLHIKHVAPEKLDIESVETPHYINTYRKEMPLIKAGMLTVTARTEGKPLVMANLLTTTAGGEPDIQYNQGDGYVTGTAAGKAFAFSTRPGHGYRTDGLSTDALALTWDEEKVFAALCTTLKKNGETLIRSKETITCEVSGDSVKYYLAKESAVSIGLVSRPQKVMLNGKRIKNLKYDKDRKELVLILPAGEGLISF
jgi:hypothetical protein